MSVFRSDDQNELARMESLAEDKPASELNEVIEPGEKVAGKPKTLDFKTRLNALKAKAKAQPPAPTEKMPESVPTQVEKLVLGKGPMREIPLNEEDRVQNLHPGVEIVPGDMSKPQNEVEAIVEADRQFMNKVADENLEAASERMITAEMLFSESLAEKSMDRERHKAVFINKVNTQLAGLTIAEIEEIIRRDHMMLFDIRTGIQASFAYRAELLKDATAEERAKALKEDWLFKPNKKVPTNEDGTIKSGKAKTAGGAKKAPFDPRAAIIATLKAKGKTQEQINASLESLGLDLLK